MIILDSNQASADESFYKYLNRLVDVYTSPLETADLFFSATIKGEPVKIGIEIKKTPSDLMSSLRDGRLMTQLPRMINTYDLAYLALVGEHINTNFENGKIKERYKGKKIIDSPYTFHHLNSIMSHFEASGGRIRHVSSIEDLTVWVMSLYRWWKKDDHKEEVFVKKHHKFIDWKSMTNPMAEVYERMGIGIKRAVTLADDYPTFHSLTMANKKELMELEGFGKKTAEKVLSFINGEQYE